MKELTKKEHKEVMEFYLNRPEGMELDHIIPLSKGGKHHVTNLQYVTKRYNRKKASILNFETSKTI